MNNKMFKIIVSTMLILIMSLVCGCGVSSQKEPEKKNDDLLIPTFDQPSAEYVDTIIKEGTSYSGEKVWDVIVEYKNTSAYPIYIQSAKLDFEDNNGHLLYTYDYPSITPYVLKGGETGYCYAYVTFPKETNFENGCQMKPDIVITKATGEYKRLTVEDTSLYESYQSVGCIGRVVNDTSDDIGLLQIEVVYKDKNGKTLGITRSSITNVKANSETSFDVSGMGTTGFSVSDVADYEVIAALMYFQW